MNLTIWSPGQDVAVDEVIVRFEGQLYTQQRFQTSQLLQDLRFRVLYNIHSLVWNFYIPGEKGGPIGVKTPYELRGSKRDRKGGNKTQAITLSLVERLPKKLYYLWMDNLFTSIQCSI